MIISWFGHSCFCIISSNGVTILTDPYDDSIGYKMPKVKPDVVLISHEHTDHNHIVGISGIYAVIRGSGKHSALGMEFQGVTTYHDEQSGAMRGENTAFCFQVDGVRVCHLGDLGHVLTERNVQEIGRVDVLFVPVGGIYTIDARGADKVVRQLHPGIAIPMHYQTDVLGFELDPVAKFLEGRAFQGPLKSLRIAAVDLADTETKVVLLDYISA